MYWNLQAPVAASRPYDDVNLPSRSRAVANFVFWEWAGSGSMQSNAAASTAARSMDSSVLRGMELSLPESLESSAHVLRLVHLWVCSRVQLRVDYGWEYNVPEFYIYRVLQYEMCIWDPLPYQVA
jgi:hypothetical protein